MKKSEACTCFVNGKTYEYGKTIYNTTDGLGNCITANTISNDFGNNSTTFKNNCRTANYSDWWDNCSTKSNDWPCDNFDNECFTNYHLSAR
ncbi:hypothetical protein EYF80_067427 [Liparis tanakae]|uniref:Uncharacterized protein n=1 Tax=Liparis tanakae TaxID=230148 RepID=A0A4Z2E145_9TELE|nr:hypothetical protein EYF80_067427 [Liparis tanakae]